jgi:hypothetical protein
MFVAGGIAKAVPSCFVLIVFGETRNNGLNKRGFYKYSVEFSYKIMYTGYIII